MHPAEFARRAASGNALYPYTWTATYEGGGRLRQFDADGPHRSADIDLARVRAILAEGPGGPFEFRARDRAAWGAPSAALIRARVEFTPGPDPVWAVERNFGFLYNGQETYLAIDDAGRVWMV